MLKDIKAQEVHCDTTPPATTGVKTTEVGFEQHQRRGKAELSGSRPSRSGRGPVRNPDTVTRPRKVWSAEPMIK